jgi:hypothetical protein
MRFTLFLTVIILTGLAAYAKLLAMADTPPHVYINSCPAVVTSSQQPQNAGHAPN